MSVSRDDRLQIARGVLLLALVLGGSAVVSILAAIWSTHPAQAKNWAQTASLFVVLSMLTGLSCVGFYDWVGSVDDGSPNDDTDVL